MPELWEQSTLVKQLISGTAPGQTIYTKEQAAAREGEVDPGWQAIIDLMNQYAGEAAVSDTAALDLQAELGRGGLALQWAQLAAQQGQFETTQAFLEGVEEFKQQDIVNQRLLEAAGLATGPTGAIQLAYLARGEGAPQAEVASIFQNLPFIQELLHGQNVPGFGLPEQLGGPGRAGADVLAGPVAGAGVKGGVLVPTPTGAAPAPAAAGAGGLTSLPRAPAGTPSSAIAGKGLGVTLPGKKSITRQAYGTLSAFEQEFLGALGQSETGQSAVGFLEDIIKSFIPTRAAGAISIA